MVTRSSENLQRKVLIYMAINEAIITKIDELPIKKDDKKLLKELLAYQEHGSWQYTKQYTAIIKDYLEKKK